ncbi:MAG TPA: alpha-amylase, partial [bacterium]|nr:alpha-amylase [bacterium]
SERRIKRSPLRDVASMLRSLSYAASAALNRPIWQSTGQGRGELILPAWIAYWERWSTSAFLRAYLDEARGSGILPPQQEDLEVLLDSYMLEKALYEVAYELNNRPDWLSIPLRGIHQLLDQRPAQGL